MDTDDYNVAAAVQSHISSVQAQYNSCDMLAHRCLQYKADIAAKRRGASDQISGAFGERIARLSVYYLIAQSRRGHEQ